VAVAAILSVVVLRFMDDLRGTGPGRGRAALIDLRRTVWRRAGPVKRALSQISGRDGPTIPA